MTGLFALSMSWLIGHHALKCFKDRDSPSLLMDIFLALGLGAGISSQIVFYALLISGHIDPALIIEAHVLCLFALFFYNRRQVAKHSPNILISSRSVLTVFVVLFLVILMASLLALVRPWGDWDGWSYWNFHANFLFRAGYGWQRIFEFNIQAHHPWSFPLLIIWGWCIYGMDKQIVPLGLGVIFTVSTAGLLIGSLKKYMPLKWSLLGGIFLTSIPIFMEQGTSQYADIVAAFFILLSCVLVMDLLERPSRDTAVLTGLCLGLTAGVKDNSMVAALLLLVLVMMRLSRTEYKILIKPLVGGFLLFGVSVALMKSFDFFYANGGYEISQRGLVDGQKWFFIGKFVFRALTSHNWGGLWPLAFIVFMVQSRKQVRGEAGILVQFVVLYIILYFVIFTLSVLNVEWLLSVSFDRSLYLIAPTVVLMMFHAAVSGEDQAWS